MLKLNFAYIPFILLAVALITLWVSTIAHFVRERRLQRCKMEEDEDITQDDLPLLVRSASVFSKRNNIMWYGSMRAPQQQLQFFVTFLTENEEYEEYQVTQEMYENLVEGQTGTLLTLNGQLFDFGDGQEPDGCD